MIKIIAGLGNPGAQYEKTRHNAGFLFLDYLVDYAGARWSVSDPFQAQTADFSVGAFKIMLLKPMTFMNRSGMAVGKVLRYYKFNPDELLVVHDELDLPEGVVKLKRDGGHAGHNGLRDIMAHIGSRDFYRLRVGIGRPSQGLNVADYVLSNPSKVAFGLFESNFAALNQRIDLLVQGDIAALNAALPVIDVKN